MLLVIAMLGAACSGDGSGTATTTTAPPPTTTALSTTTSSTTTTSTTTTTTSTTTTTTLPPGLQPQQLAFGFDPEVEWVYEATQVASVEIDAEEGVGGVFEDLDERTVVTTSVTGSLHRVVLERPDGRFELIDDLRPDAGEISGEAGTFSFTQEFADWELDEIGAFDGASILDETGAKYAYDGGAPGYHAASTPFADAWGSLGPPLPERELDEGDTWELRVETPLLGSMEFAAEIVAEVEHEEIDAFEIEYRGGATALPIELTFEEAAAISVEQGGADFISDLDALAELADEASISITDARLDGRYVLDPSTGTVLEQHELLVVEERLELTAEGETVALTIVITYEIDLVLTEAAEARWPDIRWALTGFTTDGWRLADQALNPLLDLDLADTPDEQIEAAFAALDGVSGDIFAGLSYVTVIGADGTDALVLSIVNGGGHRGAPYLAEELTAFLAGYQPGRVRVVGSDIMAYRATIGGSEWLVWAGRSEMFIVIGNRAAQNELMGLLVAGSPDYLWEAGDCLDFSDDHRSEAPYAPYGPFGLRHCEIPHGWEVLWSVEEIPDVGDQWSIETVDWVHQECGRVYFDRFDRPPGELGLRLTVYHPDAMEWERGDRYGACLLSELDEEGPISTRGRIDPAAEREPIVLEVGVCLAGETIGAIPVPCERSHNSEVISIGEFPESEDGGRLGLEARWETAEEVCPEALEEYGVTDGPYDVTWSMISDAGIGWDAGVRTYACVAYVEGADGFPLGIAGSFTGDWEAAGAQVEA